MRPAAIFAGSKAPTIRRRLIGLIILSALPVWIASAALILRDYLDGRANGERNARAAVRALMMSVDRDLASVQTAAQVLATSRDLTGGNLGAFHERARLALRPTIGNNVVLTDSAGQQVLNTLVPYGQPLTSHGNQELVRAVFAAGEPMISDLYTGGVLGRPVLSVDVPVFQAGEVIYDLSIGLFPERLGQLLREEGLPSSWVAAIFDTNGIIVARTHAPEAFVGHRGAAGLIEQLRQRRDGIVETETLEGIPVSSTFTRSKVSNWAVAIGIPTAELTAPLWRSLGLSLAGTLCLMALGIVAARLLSERLTRPIRALAAPAYAFGRGEPVEIPPLGLAEAEELGRALVAGSQLLARRTAERDATERERLLVLAAKQQTQQEARIRSAYFAYLSHELRSPLTAVLGYVELLAATASGLSSREQGYLQRMEEGGQHMLSLINEILDYAQFEAREIRLDLQPVEIGSLLRGAVDLLAGQAQRGGIDLTLDLEQDLPRVVADPKRLRQIAINLLSNALKFTHAGGSITVTVRDWRDGTIMIEVADTGIGIAEEDLPRIMQPFAQVMEAQSRKHHGTGLGLPLTKGLVELHGGSFEIVSRLKQGTRVTIRLPLAGPASAEGVRQSSPDGAFT